MSETNVKVLTDTPEETVETSPFMEKAKDTVKTVLVVSVASVAVFYATKAATAWMVKKLSDDDETPSESTTS